MTRLPIVRCLVAAVCMISPLLAFAQRFQRGGAFFISFQVPDSMGTFASSINDALSVTGYYVDANQHTHGFVRHANGDIISFDVTGSLGTQPVGVNAAEEVAGNYQDIHGFSRGFVRLPSGTIDTFNPGSSGGATVVTGINAMGTVTGYFTTTNIIPPAYGFVRYADGAVITFGIPGSTEVIPESINVTGDVTGYFYFENNTSVGGFVRSPDGTISTFDFESGIVPESINADGAIAGWDATPEFHGFLRSPRGVITSFDTPGNILTQNLSINGAGALVGSYQVQQSLPPFSASHGFLRSPGGRITSFDPPGATQTTATSIDNVGVITGWYYSSTMPNAIGFLRVPAGRRGY